jgi:16S rRNA (guanine1207-N2)-methyltransferase
MAAVELLYQAALDLTAPQALVINAQPHPLLEQLQRHTGQLDLQQHFKPAYNAIRQHGLPVTATWPESEHQYELILLLPAKNRQQTHAWMARAMALLNSHGTLLFACANHHGAKSYQSALKTLAGQVASRSKAKCRLCSAHKTDAYNSALAAEWISNGEARRIDAHGLISRPGLFSWIRADAGSALLLEQLPALTGAGMDLCCGYGLLAATLLRESDAGSPNSTTHIDLVEADRLALDCAAENTAKWRPRVSTHWLDAAGEALPAGLDWVVCNPPFHSGQQRDVELGQAIVARACDSLKSGGTLWLVANRQLPYEHLLRSRLRQCEAAIERDGFKVIKGIR